MAEEEQGSTTWTEWAQRTISEFLNVHFVITLVVLYFWMWALGAPLDSLAKVILSLTATDADSVRLAGDALDSGVGAVLLRNESSVGHWIAFRLVGTKSPRDGYGARLLLTAERGTESLGRTFECRSARSYLSACDPRIRIGLGPAPVTVKRVEVRWPSGQRQVLEQPAIDRVHTVTEP